MSEDWDSWFNQKLSLDELHKRAYESLNKYDNYNNGDFEDMPKTKHEDEEFNIENDYSIEEEIKNPYDYGSKEYLEAIQRINEKRLKYRNDKTAEKILLQQKLKNNTR